ncbi:peptidylprolyl isomerase [bacterium]|jgi:peptidyl-prolyl cis-trans isomerase C|nr:peptidylprolyl isomerase [bacterium]
MKTRFGVVLATTLFSINTLAAAEVATVNGKNITDTEMKSSLAGFTDSQRQSILGDATQRRNLLNSLIDREVLVQEAEKTKLDQDAEYKKALEGWRKDYLSNRMLEKALAPQMGEASAKKYYELNQNKYNTDQVHVQHILLAEEDDAKDMLKKVKAPGADFMALAEKHSKDPSAKNNRGDIGFITREAPFVKEFKDAAFKGSKGQILGPVKTAFGWHLIKIVEKKIGNSLGYEEVEFRVKSDMKQELIQGYLKTLKQNAKVQINDKNLNKM